MPEPYVQLLPKYSFLADTLPTAYIYQPVNHINNVNGLVILSSATLAIIQYIDTKYQRSLEDTQKKASDLNLPTKDEDSSDEAKKIREVRDNLLNDTAKSPKWLIRILLGLLPFYAFIHLGLDICPVNDSWIGYCIKLSSLIVFGLSSYMLFWINQVAKHKKKLSQTIDSLNLISTGFSMVKKTPPQPSSPEDEGEPASPSSQASPSK